MATVPATPGTNGCNRYEEPVEGGTMVAVFVCGLAVDGTAPGEVLRLTERRQSDR